jgi:hypothetical protein
MLKKKTCNYDSHKEWYSKTWHFLWHEDTWLSFLADALIVIIIGKFLLFPLFGLLLSSSYPAVAVVSESMDHNGIAFDTWWDANENKYTSYNITKSEFKEYYYSNGFSKGDILVVKGQDKYKVGDVIVYSVQERSNPIIHRIVSVNEDTYSTYGDANSGQLAFEGEVTQEQIAGKAIFEIPYLGWVKVGAVELFNWIFN